MNVNRCPKCKEYIIGTYCHSCDIDINDYQDAFPFFNDIFGDNE